MEGDSKVRHGRLCAVLTCGNKCGERGESASEHLSLTLTFWKTNEHDADWDKE